MKLIGVSILLKTRIRDLIGVILLPIANNPKTIEYRFEGQNSIVHQKVYLVITKIECLDHVILNWRDDAVV